MEQKPFEPIKKVDQMVTGEKVAGVPKKSAEEFGLVNDGTGILETLEEKAERLANQDRNNP